MLLPAETHTPEGEIAYGVRLTYIMIVWLALTVFAAVLLIVLAPALTGVY